MVRQQNTTIEEEKIDNFYKEVTFRKLKKMHIRIYQFLIKVLSFGILLGHNFYFFLPLLPQSGFLAMFLDLYSNTKTEKITLRQIGLIITKSKRNR